MVADSIEREITIAAPREQVWEVLTQAEFLGVWFGTGTPVRIDLRPGGRMPLDHDDRGTPAARIERVEPPAVLALRRPQGGTGAEPGEGSATLVTFTLVTFTLATEPGGHTRLRMTESGFASLAHPHATVRTHSRPNGTGWTRKLTDFACHTERLTLRR
ncbi:SRPBCC domain-containing protein [Kitasatospora sp. NPDC057692]|uniref:SRPBCC domain-containing protein n=1 Tax=Kitasatospora sp. NPDC057692 TaxID=3346215 RepID=UPI0036CFBDD5